MAQQLLDRRDVDFVIWEQMDGEHILKHDRYSGYDRRMCDMILSEARTLAIQELIPTLAEGDREGVRYEQDAVSVPGSFHRPYDLLLEGGWQRIHLDEEMDGHGAPPMVAQAALEYLAAANWSLLAYATLGTATAEMIQAFGTKEQKETYVPRLVSGEWGGTMLLTEPEAGSDVGALTTRAERKDDGTYSLTGNKIYITNGEHDLADNIVHPVLARIEGDPPGTAGISLFLVPKFFVHPDGSLGGRNDIRCEGVEEKHGIHGSATCSMSLGAKGEWFVPCSGGNEGARLVGHDDVDYVILTGGTETGMAMLAQKPDMLLSAETGGKNATIVTAMADRDQAIKNVIYSAFGNSGQKCSATSLLILEDEVYNDESFKRQLVDAAKSFKLGSSWDFSNKMSALIHPPSGVLEKALTTLEPGESWALEPQMAHNNPHMWTPGIKYGVQPGSFTHMTEFFGPVLGVMHARDLDQAIELVNQTGYGLTSGIESLDAREQARWKSRVRAGNLYINRGTTAAVTLRQPFGGMGKSALGPGIKAGSPNYVTTFMDYEELAPPRVPSIAQEDMLLRTALAWRRKILWGGLQPMA